MNPCTTSREPAKKTEKKKKITFILLLEILEKKNKRTFLTGKLPYQDTNNT